MFSRFFQVWRFLLVSASLVGCTESPSGPKAVEGGGHLSWERGTAGLTAAPLEIDNHTGKVVACFVSLAHWYSMDLGSLTAGERITVPLWVEEDTGTVFLLNDQEDRMPLDNMWCGLGGEAWETRAVIALERRAGVAAQPGQVVCAVEGEGLVCR
ncbi:hypothetical protein [Rhodospirillum sp. A1_3_36]|uniref:hypothetical protein n=1 Tax=Rhodospirillum sp. A1_3_36 TaxID=3391666 RepID=UPI0039A56D4F